MERELWKGAIRLATGAPPELRETSTAKDYAMTNRLLLSIVGLAALVGYCFHRGQCTAATKTEVKEDLGRWDGEGGNDPAVATPSPAPLPRSSVPAPGSDARH